MSEILPSLLERFWKGSVFASIAHAVAVSRYPDSSNTHSWDGNAYSVQDDMGSRGTASFSFGEANEPSCCAGAVFTLKSDRRRLINDRPTDPMSYFRDAGSQQVELSQQCFQYLLDEFNGHVSPWVTAGFWSVGNQLVSQDSWAEFIRHGGHLFEIQLSTEDIALEYWRAEFDLSENEVDLVLSSYRQRVSARESWITLSQKQAAIIHSNEVGFNECQESLAELLIRLPSSS